MYDGVWKDAHPQILGAPVNFREHSFYEKSRRLRRKKKKERKYQPSGTGGTRSPPATPHRLPVGPEMVDGVWKGVYP